MNSKMRSSAHSRRLTYWGYLAELLPACILALALYLICGNEAVVNWLLEWKADLLKGLELAFTLSGVIFGAFIAVLCTDFGKQLRIAGAANDYTLGLAWPILANGTAMFTLMGTTPGKSWVSKLTLFFLIYAVLNCVNMVRNVVGLVRIWQDVDRARHLGHT